MSDFNSVTKNQATQGQNLNKNLVSELEFKFKNMEVGYTHLLRILLITNKLKWAIFNETLSKKSFCSLKDFQSLTISYLAKIWN